MFQKLEKCEVKAYSVEIEEIDCHPILREINCLVTSTMHYAPETMKM